MLKKTNSLSTMTEIILLMSSLMKFIEKSRKKSEVTMESGDNKDEDEDDDQDKDDDINPLWILDDLANIGQQFTNVTQFELSCLFSGYVDKFGIFYIF